MRTVSDFNLVRLFSSCFTHRGGHRFGVGGAAAAPNPTLFSSQLFEVPFGLPTPKRHRQIEAHLRRSIRCLTNLPPPSPYSQDPSPPQSESSTINPDYLPVRQHTFQYQEAAAHFSSLTNKHPTLCRRRPLLSALHSCSSSEKGLKGFICSQNPMILIYSIWL
ncbi:hypothetical protein K1719_003669 [Acacia pycnantha]|nr:hypothetical protein K1719_003669 [Acacia pycnantha]